MKTKYLRRSLLATLIALTASAQAHEFSSVQFFGDSLSDSGYYRAALSKQLGANAAAVGEYSTNPDHAWSVHFAQKLGQNAIANAPYAGQAGNNHAIGGARAGVTFKNQDKIFENYDKKDELIVTSAKEQISSHLANSSIDPNGVYVLWTGANDLFAASKDAANQTQIILESVQAQAQSVAMLNQAGAKYIVLPNIPDVGLTPDYVNHPITKAVGTQTAQLYNNLVFNAIKSSSPDANVIVLDSFGLLQQVAANPAAFGFQNMTEKACRTGSLTCTPSDLVQANANNTYFFADGVHPAGRAHRMIADYADSVIKAPTQMSVLPRLATTAADDTMNQLQTHIENTRQAAPSAQNSRAWATIAAGKSQVAKLDGKGGTAMIGTEFINTDTQSTTGVYVSHSRQEFDKAGNGLNEADFHQTGIGAYHAGAVRGVTYSVGVGFDRIDVDTARRVALDSYQTTHTANSSGKQVYAHLQAGYPFNVQSATVTPYIGANIVRTTLDGFKENSADATAMHFDEQKYQRSLGKVGINASLPLAKAQLFADVHYQKQLSDKQNAVSAQLNTLPLNSFETPAASFGKKGFGAALGVTTSIGSVDLKAGISHEKLDDDKQTSGFIGASVKF